MVARFARSLRPIHRIKHVVDFQTAVPVNVQITQLLVNTVDTQTLGTQNSVENGASINGFFITTEINATEAGVGKTPNFYWMLYKNPGATVATIPNGNAVGVSTFKKFVIHQEMVMFQANSADDGVPRNVFKGVIAVPKHLRRCSPGDQWYIQLFIPSTGVACNACTQVHYKSFR